MQTTIAALAILSSTLIPLWWRNSTLAVSPEVLEEASDSSCVCGPSAIDCPECACVLPAQTVSESYTSAAGAGIVGALTGAGVTALVQHGRENRAGVEAGAAIGDPIPW